MSSTAVLKYRNTVYRNQTTNCAAVWNCHVWGKCMRL